MEPKNLEQKIVNLENAISALATTTNDLSENTQALLMQMKFKKELLIREAMKRFGYSREFVEGYLVGKR